MPSEHLSKAQVSRKHMKLQLHKAGAHEGIDKLVAILMRQLPIQDPWELIDAAEKLKKKHYEIWVAPTPEDK